MTPSNATQATAKSLTRDVVDVTRHYLLGRRGLFILAGLVVAAGLVFGWSWLVAVGIAPVLLAGLPCIAMCALGLCMRGMGGRSCSMSADASHAIDTPTERDVNTAGSNPAKPAQEEEHENA